jgi:aryl-alcohol dehydrogenase-like predicted oxidoreductase
VRSEATTLVAPRYGAAMRVRTVGGAGPAVSVVGVGCNTFGRQLDERGARAVVDAALDAGITLFDTAESYGGGASEEFLGRALAGRRDRAVIATKFGWSRGPEDGELARGSRKYLRGAIEGSLRRLATDRVDLYQYHRPDGITPIEETLGAMGELVAEGKVRFIGSSQMSAAQVVAADELAAERGWPRFVSAQNEYSLLERGAERELVPACERLGVGVIPFFPLARGLLTGKYRRGRPPPAGTRLATQGLDVAAETWDRLGALEVFARERGATLLEVAIGGLAAQPAVASVIAGATSAEQVRANAAAGAWEPTPADVEALREL